MINIIDNPERKSWEELCSRPSMNLDNLNEVIKSVFAEVSAKGDIGLRQLTEKFDGVKLESLAVRDEEWEAVDSVDSELKKAIDLAANNIEKFHKSQSITTEVITSMPGVRCWQKSVGIEKIGIYIPGGSAPLFSTILMLAIPAKIAGCKEIILCTPPNKFGLIDPVMLYACNLLKIKNVFKVGGAQAIAAMAMGTESIPKVYKIFGPGNQYVTAAKQYAQLNNTAIDMPAGPSELLVLCDSSSTPTYVAADLLSQAEHGADSQVLCISKDRFMLEAVGRELTLQLIDLPRKELASSALLNARFIFLDSSERIIDFVNEYAPEHLIIDTENNDFYVGKVVNAGSVFIGKYTPESAGDYASGTNHTLPTNGFAKMYSGVNIDAFVKKITYQEISKEGLLSIGPAVEIMAEAEELQAHKNAVSIRLKDLK